MALSVGFIRDFAGFANAKTLVFVLSLTSCGNLPVDDPSEVLSVTYVCYEGSLSEVAVIAERLDVWQTEGEVDLIVFRDTDLPYEAIISGLTHGAFSPKVSVLLPKKSFQWGQPKLRLDSRVYLYERRGNRR